jgi:hypothetical protein
VTFNNKTQIESTIYLIDRLAFSITNVFRKRSFVKINGRDVGFNSFAIKWLMKAAKLCSTLLWLMVSPKDLSRNSKSYVMSIGNVYYSFVPKHACLVHWWS